MTTAAMQTFGSTFSFGGVDIAELGDMTGPGETAEFVDVTTHDSPAAYRQKEPTILDGGEYTFTLFYYSEVGQDALRTAFEGRTVADCVLEWPAAQGGGGVTFPGFVSAWSWATPLAGVLTADIGITVAGPVVLDNPGS